MYALIHNNKLKTFEDLTDISDELSVSASSLYRWMRPGFKVYGDYTIYKSTGHTKSKRGGREFKIINSDTEDSNKV